MWNQGSLDLEELVELSVEAENAGWDGVFVSDSSPFEKYPDPWVLLSGIATRMTEVRLGTWVVPVPRREPWQLAQEVATLDRLSDGRVIFGAGLGNSDDYEAYGRAYTPRELASRLEESLEAITNFWSGEPVTYGGDHYTLENAEVQPTPVQQPLPPIVVGCWWPNKPPFRRGARWDGIMPCFPSLTEAGTGPHGEEAVGSPVDEVREALTFYHNVADDPGEILLPTVPTDDLAEYVEICEELERPGCSPLTSAGEWPRRR